MNLDPHEVELIRQYLLGQLSPEGRTGIEERLLADGEFFEEILISEEELIDDYVAQQLSDSEVQAFESNFLVTPERRKQLRFARRLAKYVGEDTEAVEEVDNEVATEPGRAPIVVPGQKRSVFSFFPSLSPALSYSLAAVILLAVVGVSWLVVMNGLGPSRTGKTLAVTLGPGLTRDGGEIKRIKVSSNDQVEMRLLVPPRVYQVYRIRLLADDNSEVWASGDQLAVEESGNNVVISSVQPGVLTPGDYRAILSGRSPNGSFEDVASYSFRVTR